LCTRAVYIGSDGLVITGRSMDWQEDMRSNLWALPRGASRSGAAGPNSISWVSKYGSLVVSGYDTATVDGINERGLAANLLYLAESDYGTPDPKKPSLLIALWAQYALDNFATVAEAVAALAAEPFQIVAPAERGHRAPQLHLSLSDATGDSAIFEYLDGRLVVHHGRQYVVMTNSPRFEDQLALNQYWNGIGGNAFLPGTHRAADRFVRASFLIASIPRQSDPHIIGAVHQSSYAHQSVASVMSVMRSVSVPLGITMPGEPNISSTLWRIAADHKNMLYFFDSATVPNAFWVEMRDLDFAPGAPAKKLTLTDGRAYAGNAALLFEAAEPFRFGQPISGT
jgi:choloylglycine hydrolase